MGHKWVTIAGFWDLKTGKTAVKKKFLRRIEEEGSHPDGDANFFCLFTGSGHKLRFFPA